MRLRALQIHRLPGISPGFTLDDIHPGVNIIVGPNASGKSSLLRALRAALYREEQRDAPMHVVATFDDAAGTLTAARLGRELTWYRHGQAVEGPPLPEHRFLPCYVLHVEDLLDADGATDREIAQRLARDLAGGYDLGALRDNPPFQVRQHHGRNERRVLALARDRQMQIQIEQRALSEDETRLAALRAERQACTEAAAEAAAVAKALEWLEHRRRRKELDEQMAAFPAGMERLRGDERRQLEQLHEARRAQDEALQRARHEREQAQQRLAVSGLADAPVDEARIADRRHQLQRLQRLETEARQHRAELERAGPACEAAITALGGQPDRVPQLQPDTLRQIEEALTDKRRLDAELRELDAALDRLPVPGDEGPEAEPLRRGREALLAWLAASRAAPKRAVRAAVLSVLTIVLLGAGAAAVLVHWAAALTGIPLAALAYRLLRPTPATGARNEARRRFAECALPEPASWQSADVAARLTEIDRGIAQAERRAADLARREETGRRRAAKAAELEETGAALADVAARVGFDPRTLDAAFDRWLRLTNEYDRARTDTERARQALAARLEEAQQVRGDLLAFLAAYDEAPDMDIPDSAALSERLEGLAGRIRQRDGARRDLAAAEREIEQAAGAIEEGDARARELFARIGLEGGDEAELDHRIERLEAWKQLRNALERARLQELDRRQAVRERPDLAALVEANDKGALEVRHGELDAQAARAEPLGNEITRIETLAGEARRKRNLEQARAAWQAAEDALRERLDEALFAAAGTYLLGEVREEHVQTSRPAALRRAAEWFQRFTRHQFTLEFSTDGEQRFAALETASGERRRLTELSSGTRMQLLLAVRIAFALEAERGREPLPLVLDEALTTADPERFAAAAHSLGTLARENDRQVFYLTAQPGDIRYWRSRGLAAHCIDLARVRRMGQAVTDPQRLAVPAPADIPEPAGRTPEAYAVALGVPPVDPWSPPAAVHVFYLLRDDLTLLHRLLQSGVHRVGSLRALLDSQAARILLTDKERHKLERRTAGVEGWFEAWRLGRGHPVDRQALEDSGAVSAKFLDKVAALNDRLGGDARALLDGLENGDVDRFRTDKREALHAWLTEHGYLDGRPALTEPQIGHRVGAVLASFHEDRNHALTEAQSLAASLKAGVD